MQASHKMPAHKLQDSEPHPFQDRAEAGRKLAERLTAYAARQDVVVLGLARGGVPVAYEIARALNASLDVYVVRKLGVPGHRELAMGAIASGGMRLLNEDVFSSLAIDAAAIEAVSAREQQELMRRERLYRGDRPARSVQDKIVIVVDDGAATGATIRVALAALRKLKPAKIVVAIGVAPPDTCDDLTEEADELVCLLVPEAFSAVGPWFDDFSAVSDREVCDLLAHATTKP